MDQGKYMVGRKSSAFLMLPVYPGENPNDIFVIVFTIETLQ